MQPESGRNFGYEDYTFKFTGEPNFAKPLEMDPSFSDGWFNNPLWENFKSLYHIGGFIPADAERLDKNGEGRPWDELN